MKKLAILSIVLAALSLSIININNIDVNKAKADDPFDFILQPEQDYYGTIDEAVKVSWGTNYNVDKYYIQYVDDNYNWQEYETLLYNPVLEANTIVSHDFPNPNPGEESVRTFQIISYNGGQMVLASNNFVIFWRADPGEQEEPAFIIEPEDQLIAPGEYATIHWQVNFDSTGIKHKVEWFDNTIPEWVLEGEVDGGNKDTYYSFDISPRNETTQISFRVHLTLEDKELYSQDTLIYWRGDDVELITVGFDANGGSGEMEDYLHEKGGDYYLPVCAFTAPEGKEFSHWTVDSKKYEETDVIFGLDHDVVVIANWKVIKNNDGAKKGGCGGSIIATSVILTSLSFLGIGVILLKKKED